MTQVDRTTLPAGDVGDEMALAALLWLSEAEPDLIDIPPDIAVAAPVVPTEAFPPFSLAEEASPPALDVFAQSPLLSDRDLVTAQDRAAMVEHLLARLREVGIDLYVFGEGSGPASPIADFEVGRDRLVFQRGPDRPGADDVGVVGADLVVAWAGGTVTLTGLGNLDPALYGALFAGG